MKYINKKTGATIETKSLIAGENWELVNYKKEEPEKTKKKEKAKK